MNKGKNEDIISILQSLYPHPTPPLHHKDDYTLLVAVILSARCTDKRVNIVTKQLFQLASTPTKMIELGIDNILEIIRPCGLSPQKSKALYYMSHILVKEHKGEVPNSFEALENLPGVGHKTASVVLSQAFGISTFPVDTHIHRLSYRWGIAKGKSVKQTEQACKKSFPKYLWNKLHLQMIYYGREYCPAKKHNIENCPICKKYNTLSI